MGNLPRRQRVAAYAVIVRSGRILLSRLAPHISAEELWTLPGGGIDHGIAAEQRLLAIGKVDHQFNDSNRMSVRYIYFDNFINNNVGGGLTSVQRGTDFSDRQHSSAAQLISTLRPTLLNELRVQYATRAQGRTPGTPTRPATGWTRPR